jgi:hypothetical protein
MRLLLWISEPSLLDALGSLGFVSVAASEGDSKRSRGACETAIRSLPDRVSGSSVDNTSVEASWLADDDDLDLS